MNVFSIKSNPRNPIHLTQENYNQETNREWPYIQHDGGEVKSYALCPACENPVTLVNRHVVQTDAHILYARHSGYSVYGLAVHDQATYEDCPLHNPERFDSKTRRTGEKWNEEIREALKNHIHLVIKQLEISTGITYSDKLVESMLIDFGGNRGWEYKAISLYNLPFGFAYMTEAQDLFGIKVGSLIAESINEKSTCFGASRYGYVYRKKGEMGSDIRFFFNNHRIAESALGKDSVDLMVVEIEKKTHQSKTLYKKKMEFDSVIFFSTYMRRERLRLLAQEHL